MSVPKTASKPEPVQESVLISAQPDAVYRAVSDVTRMGEWSPECTGAVLRDGGPVGLGTRFKGTNRKGRMSWATQCRVVRAEPGAEFAFDVSMLGIKVSRWGYRLVPEDGGTRVTESWTDQRTGLSGRLAVVVGGVAVGVWDRAEHNRATMRSTLNALKTHLENAT